MAGAPSGTRPAPRRSFSPDNSITTMQTPETSEDLPRPFRSNHRDRAARHHVDNRPFPRIRRDGHLRREIAKCSRSRNARANQRKRPPERRRTTFSHTSTRTHEISGDKLLAPSFVAGIALLAEIASWGSRAKRLEPRLYPLIHNPCLSLHRVMACNRRISRLVHLK